MTKDMQDHVDATDDSGSRESPGDDGGGGGGGEGMDNPAFTPDSNNPSPDDSQTSEDIKLEIEPKKEAKTDVVKKKDQTNGLPDITFKANGKKHDQLSLDQKNDYLQTVNTNVERMTMMIDDIWVISKIEAKVLEVQPETLDVAAFCQDLLREPEYSRPHTPIQFSCRSRQLMADLDPRLLRPILSNLLSNAIRYTPDDKVIYLKLAKRHNQLIFQVQDDGIGIPPEDRLHLFEPFHRGRNVSNIPGTGLGLSIVKQFVDLQRGVIEVHSRVGVGSMFTVRL